MCIIQSQTCMFLPILKFCLMLVQTVVSMSHLILLVADICLNILIKNLDKYFWTKKWISAVEICFVWIKRKEWKNVFPIASSLCILNQFPFPFLCSMDQVVQILVLRLPHLGGKSKFKQTMIRSYLLRKAEKVAYSEELSIPLL